MPYATVAELRALDGLEDAAVYPDATLQDGIDYATEVIDSYTGAAFEPKAFRVRVRGYLLAKEPVFLLGVRGPRTLTSATDDEGATVDVTGWTADPDYDEVTPSATVAARWVTLEGTASATPTPPDGIKWACRTLARQWVLDLHSRVPDRALQVQNDFGQVTLAQAGGQPDRPTSLPDVNAVLNRHRHRPPALG